jgi:selenocysteine lyase/cysteine desulfurase
LDGVHTAGAEVLGTLSGAVAAERLASESRIVCGGRGGGLRISLHAYNDGDVDRLVEAMRRL